MDVLERAVVTHVYDFVSSKITEGQVQQIIAEAGFDPLAYRYEPRVDDGFVARGAVPMNVNRLENAAKKLSIKVEITSPAAAARIGNWYGVSITMSIDTVQALSDNNYQLYGFKAVKSSMGSGVPVVWFSTSTFSTQTEVEWTESYSAYTSGSDQISSGSITATFTSPISLDQTLVVTDKTGIGNVQAGGTAGAISISNTVNTPFTTGISQLVEGENNPLCAFPLFGNGLDVIVPIQKVLLMFSTQPLNNGAVVEQAYSASMLVDLTGAPGNSRAVSFDINNGWSYDGVDWGTQFAADANLVPILIVKP
ncbi:hypothetical protein [Pseudoduganella albidiflava]|uniref:DUF2612 domain-containing protein n=1 Tax=Pseudoduganella albidiflava TaxID=321983 RepID=A0A411WXH3_9BURK|nr:hypothetical protein [Pseudoduganella albidiflava]QBI01352.1 hypothetical protein EYF70_11210 [Pseudoduganella albidiflava]GGY36333.1 hypothetical protein GCM10007387_18320 [Pseudoduganella albidiflava]